MLLLIGGYPLGIIKLHDPRFYYEKADINCNFLRPFSWFHLLNYFLWVPVLGFLTQKILFSFRHNFQISVGIFELSLLKRFHNSSYCWLSQFVISSCRLCNMSDSISCNSKTKFGAVFFIC